MFEKYDTKDVVRINQEFDAGKIINSGSLSFAISEANISKSWLKSCAILVRAVLIDHVFEEGNKRTAAGIIVAFLEENRLKYDPEKISRVIAKMLMKNVTSIKIIELEVKNVIIS
ncbi:hypothetical protein HY483_02210 [Candidatus Woesearchaeota archaeon]|nr:hypothetical protein [Candidatus Woesearchaeota archaeon]